MTNRADNCKKKIISLAFYTNQAGNVTHKFNTSNAILTMASDRLQFKPALDAAVNLGFLYEIHSLHSDRFSDILEIGKADICLVTKMSANTNKLNQSMTVANLAALTLLKKEGAKIIVQYCDNMLAQADTGNLILKRFYECLFSMADVVTFPCEKMRRLVAEHLNSNIKTFVINDPWQLSKYYKPRKILPNKRCRLIWFGNNKNIKYLINSLDKIMENSPRQLNFLLTIVGRKESHDLILKYLKTTNKQYPGWRFKLVEWNDKDPIKQLEEELSKSHISIIPSDPKDPLKSGVSHNRLVDSIRAGCVTIASPMESYLEFSDIAILGENFDKLLHHAIREYEFYCAKMLEARDQKLRQFDPEYNAKSWKEFWLNIQNS